MERNFILKNRHRQWVIDVLGADKEIRLIYKTKNHPNTPSFRYSMKKPNVKGIVPKHINYYDI